MTGRLRWLMALLAVVALLGAACGDDGTDQVDGDDTGAPTVESPADDGDGTDGGTDTVELADFEFVPADLTVASGTTLTLENTGQAPHTFTISDEGIDEQVDAGQSGEVTIDLDAGEYDFVCTFHEAQGMVGTLTVE